MKGRTIRPFPSRHEEDAYMDAVTALNKLASALYPMDGDVKVITLRRGPRAGSWVATVTREVRIYLPDPNA